MYKKTKPRSVMELLNKNLSEREVAAILGCSRNTVSEIKELCRQQGMTWDDIQDMTDDGLYDILYPKKFRRTTNYVPVDYAYVHSELKKTGVTMKLLWEEYRDRCVSEGREYFAYPAFTVNYYKYTGDQPYTAQAGSRGRGGLVWSYNVICGRGYRRNHNRISVCRHTAIQPVWVCGSSHGYERKGVA